MKYVVAAVIIAAYVAFMLFMSRVMGFNQLDKDS